MEEKLNRVGKQDKCLEDKLTELLEGWMTQVVIERDSEMEEMGEGEESEAMGMEEVSTTGGTQLSVMEVDEEEEEDEVIVVEEIKWDEMWKRAPLSPPKTLRKRVCVGMVTQTPVGSQVQGGLMQGSQAGSGQAGSMWKPCDRCVKHWTQCMVVSGGARCENCQVKHYRCLLMLVKKVVGGKGGPLGTQQMKAVVGSQVKGWARKVQKPITLGKSSTCCQSIVTNIHLRSWKDGDDQEGLGHKHSQGAVHIV